MVQNYQLCDQYLTWSTSALRNILIKKKQVHILRYLAKITLQHCAVKSELELHSEAHSLANDSFLACFEALKISQDLCKHEVDQNIILVKQETVNKNSTILKNSQSLASINPQKSSFSTQKRNSYNRVSGGALPQKVIEDEALKIFDSNSGSSSSHET